MELTARIAELRSKILSNTVTKEELREACAALRADRAGAAERRAITKAKAAPVDGTALLAKLAAFTKS
jgi:benzoyl-CoA reductase/2-hydroxyglutaryl-CoA dehydratase subunit BcrC/BadD/HgdB